MRARRRVLLAVLGALLGALALAPAVRANTARDAKLARTFDRLLGPPWLGGYRVNPASFFLTTV